MPNSHYVFVTDWVLDAPLGAVWNEISRPDAWPTWWRGVIAVDLLEPGDRDGLGAYRRMVWKSRLPYELRFNVRTVRLEPLHTVEAVADGDLCGTGTWSLTPLAAGTAVRYEWTVEANRPWMRWLAPIARPIFRWNHNVIMRWGREGLERRLSR